MKAGFVRFLKVDSECVLDDGKDNHSRAMDYLLNALVNMHSLSDFRLLDERQLWVTWKTLNSLNKILWSVYELFDLLRTNCSLVTQ